MCLILFAYEAHPRYRLIVAANRDEFFQRPTAKARFWSSNSEVLGGLDLEKMGTWLGITRTGRFAAVTNFRELAPAGGKVGSRGELVKNYLCDRVSPAEYLEKVKNNGQYEGFNLLVGDLASLWYYSNRQKPIIRIVPGIYGLSNHLLDTPWPKVLKGKEALRGCLENQEKIDCVDLFKILADPARAADDDLPDTGVGLERERILSAIYIDSEGYGTRSSTVLLVDRLNKVTFIERSFPEGIDQWEEVKFEFSITSKSYKSML